MLDEIRRSVRGASLTVPATLRFDEGAARDSDAIDVLLDAVGVQVGAADAAATGQHVDRVAAHRTTAD